MDLMNLTPVQATLIATVVTTMVTTSTVAGTHLLTRTRERRHLIWNRRMDAYGAAVQSSVDLARMRRDTVERVNRESYGDTVPDLTALGLVGAQVEMFGSPQVADLWNEFYAAVASWKSDLDRVEGRMQVTYGGYFSIGEDYIDGGSLPSVPLPPTAEQVQADNRERFYEAEDHMKAVDARLIKAIKREARFQRPR
ncbi:hypothetical protein ABZY57_04305 [Streptomyces sp. NPDC006450]|uniref:hypothetical protein n=1 Tax=Streptomyces sp. NPDC006450 TaxID=3155458 RepID=UPI0033B98219